VKSIRLANIVVDGGTQVRAAISEDVVADYAEQFANGIQFPPIVLFHDGNQYYLGDGFHRVMAARRAGWIDINADVRQGTKTDALWFALGANKENGARLTSADKRHAILIALKTWPERSGRQIAEQIGCSAMWVSKVKDETGVNHFTPEARVTGKDGKSYPATRPSKTEPDAPAPPGARRTASEAFQARIAAAAEGASEALSRKLPRKNTADLITNVVHTLQGVTSAIAEIEPESALSDPQAPYWRHHIAEAIGALRKFNKRLQEAEAA
jgi:hypothetical protein